jgi:hypothetical protein
MESDAEDTPMQAAVTVYVPFGIPARDPRNPLPLIPPELANTTLPGFDPSRTSSWD